MLSSLYIPYRSLYLSSNHIQKIENLQTLTLLRVLELGSNQLRTIENLSSLINLEELWLGRNKIKEIYIEQLAPLRKLRKLSVQSNRLMALPVGLLQALPSLQELYASHNAISSLDGVLSPSPSTAQQPGQIQSQGQEHVYVPRLTLLDLGANRLPSLSLCSMSSCVSLQELWLNDNQIDNWTDIRAILPSFKGLKTIYLERNPVQAQCASAQEYKQNILTLCPNLEQLDADVFKY